MAMTIQQWHRYVNGSAKNEVCSQLSPEENNSKWDKTLRCPPCSYRWLQLKCFSSDPRTCKWSRPHEKKKLPSSPSMNLQISVKQSWNQSIAVKRKSHCLSSASISMASSGSFQEWTSKVRLMEVAHFKNGKQSSFDNAWYLLWANPVFHNRSSRHICWLLFQALKPTGPRSKYIQTDPNGIKTLRCPPCSNRWL